MKKKKYYRCYSLTLKKYLLNQGFKYCYEGFNKKTKKQYWDFRLTEMLSIALTKYSNNKIKIN